VVATSVAFCVGKTTEVATPVHPNRRDEAPCSGVTGAILNAGYLAVTYAAGDNAFAEMLHMPYAEGTTLRSRTE